MLTSSCQPLIYDQRFSFLKANSSYPKLSVVCSKAMSTLLEIKDKNAVSLAQNVF